MFYYKEYKEKLVSPEEAVLSIRSNQTVAFAQLGCCPHTICEHMTLLQGKATGVRT